MEKRCYCGGLVSERERRCNRCGISVVRLLRIMNNNKNQLTQKLSDRWIKEGVAPTDDELEILPIEMYEWL